MEQKLKLWLDTCLDGDVPEPEKMHTFNTRDGSETISALKANDWKQVHHRHHDSGKHEWRAAKFPSEIYEFESPDERLRINIWYGKLGFKFGTRVRCELLVNF